MATGMVLDGSVRLEVHFSFSNPKFVPESVRKWDEKKKETSEQLYRRKNEYVKGVLMIEPTEKCSVAGILEGLEAAGFKMWDAECQTRINPKNPQVNYQMVRFMFSREEPADELYRAMFTAVRSQIRAGFLEMVRVAMWRFRGYLNPLFKDGKRVADGKNVSITLDVRVPYGTKERRWGIDESVFIKPVRVLCVVDNAVTLVPASQ